MYAGYVTIEQLGGCSIMKYDQEVSKKGNMLFRSGRRRSVLNKTGMDVLGVKNQSTDIIHDT
jgi:hypothetical protein